MAIDPKTGRTDSSTSPLMVGNSRGSNTFFRNGDWGAAYQRGNTSALLALSAIAVATTSVALSTNSKGIELNVAFSDAVTTCDIQVFRVDPGPVDTLVKTFTGVSQAAADGLFVTGAEHVDLQGRQVKVRAQNFAGGGNVTVRVKVT